jgi:hypothetical protein
MNYSHAVSRRFFWIITFVMIAASPSLVWGHPGHGGLGSGEHSRISVAEGIVHSLIAIPLLLPVIGLGVWAGSYRTQVVSRIGFVASVALGCGVSRFHLDPAWTLLAQIGFIFGAGASALILFVVTQRLVKPVVDLAKDPLARRHSQLG